MNTTCSMLSKPFNLGGGSGSVGSGLEADPPAEGPDGSERPGPGPAAVEVHATESSTQTAAAAARRRRMFVRAGAMNGPSLPTASRRGASGGAR